MQQLLIVVLNCACLAAVASAGDPAVWTQWRGTDRSCRVSADTVWPDALNDTSLTRMYRIPLGPGYSGPIVTADRVFVTETVDEKVERVHALDRQTGNELWTVEWPGAMKVPFFAASNGSWIRSTPACDGRRIYVGGMLDVLVALNADTGTEEWRVDFAKEFGSGVESFGFVCSPLVDGDVVYCQTGGGLAAINCETGQVIWRSLQESGGMMGGAFSSPVIETVAGVRQLIVQTRAKLAGVDLTSGSELWSIDVPSFRGMNILTPTVMGNRIFTSSYGGGSFLFEVTASSGRFQVKQVWKQPAEAYMSSPVVVGDQLYVHLRNQRFTCIDPATGEARWTSKPFGKYWSIAVNGDRLLILDERGDLLLVAADPAEYRQLDARHVSESSTWAHIAAAGDQVFVRELDGLVVFRWRP